MIDNMNFTRELESIRKIPIERGELEIKQTEIKNAIHGFNSQVDPAEERINNWKIG